MFEQFLQDKFAEIYTGLDDEMPDRFEHWLGNLDIGAIINYADQFGYQSSIEALDKAREILKGL